MPCTLPATSPLNNGDQFTDQDRVETAWAECAGQVDMVFNHQQAAP
ncbi:putative phage protein [Pseudomonas fluorescens Q2-87]|uniref:Putative phage protein n=1 Tax=Pseudomonas fluorescens (strain Q2-87) TaxID=1038922 RepID=J2F4A8_PSEFQ|nr:putative phage protein [Pseudomonas fluorescens Q2-87]